MKKKIVKLDIPVDGCLGLLALGDIGLMAWREKKEEARKAAFKNTPK